MRLETERLILRPFVADDLEDFARMNRDPQVMRHFTAPYSRAQTRRMMERCEQKQRDDGYAFSAVIRKQDERFIGMAGLSRTLEINPLGPKTEIGWRFNRVAWNHGYASEAARAWLDYGFGGLGLEEIISYAPRPNLPSQRVMQRIGMQREEEMDFDHPTILEGNPLRRMVVYRMTRSDYLAVSAA